MSQLYAMDSMPDLHTMESIPERSVETSPAPLPNAVVTLLTDSTYLPGALVLLHSLRELHPEPRNFQIVCLVTPETVDAAAMGVLRNAGYDLVIGVEPIASGPKGESGLRLMGRPDLGLALTKLHVFRLGNLFSTILYMDADTLPLRPVSQLFEITAPHILSACPDTGWPDCFNSGVMVIRPRLIDFDGLRALMATTGDTGNGSFDGADQGLLNEYFSVDGQGGGWNRLSFTYNVTPSAAYQYAPAYKRFANTINVVHFIGPRKPWSRLAYRPSHSLAASPDTTALSYDYFLDRWYNVYDRHIRPTAAHDPDLAKKFAVPETVAVWNAYSRTADAADGEFCRPGAYTSMPLDGRVDLMMPRPQAVEWSAKRLPGTRDESSSVCSATSHSDDMRKTVSNPAEIASHSEGLNESRGVWDASRRPPPKDSRPEMVIPLTTVYASAWDEPAHAQSEYFREHRDDTFELPTLPTNVKANDWYKPFTATSPNPDGVKAVFPWEKQTQSQSAPTRVFPQRREASTEAYDAAEPTELTLPGVSLEPSQGGTESPPAQGLAQHSNCRPQPVSLSEAMATYQNAWDTSPSIARYAKRLTSLGIASERPKSAGEQTAPSSPRPGGRPRYQRQNDATKDNNTTATWEGHSSNYGQLDYVDKRVQTDRPTHHDARVQVSPESSPKSKEARTTDRMPGAVERRPSSNLPAANVSKQQRTAKARVWDPRRDVDVMKRDAQGIVTQFINPRTGTSG